MLFLQYTIIAFQKVWNMNIQTSSRWPMLVNRRSIVFLRAKPLGEKNHPRVDKCRRPLHMKAIIVYCKKSIINQTTDWIIRALIVRVLVNVPIA
jgi:hypothetical protein